MLFDRAAISESGHNYMKGGGRGYGYTPLPLRARRWLAALALYHSPDLIGRLHSRATGTARLDLSSGAVDCLVRVVTALAPPAGH